MQLPLRHGLGKRLYRRVFFRGDRPGAAQIRSHSVPEWGSATRDVYRQQAVDMVFEVGSCLSQEPEP